MGYGSNRNSASRLAWIVLSLVLFSAGSVSAATLVELSWNSNSEPDLAGYYLRYGTVSQVYTDLIDVGNVTTFDVVDLPANTTFYFVVTAYDVARNESPPSNEISVIPTTVAPLLDISANDSPDPVDAGGLLTYTLNYGNSGSADATGVVITDTVPINTTFVSATAGGTLSGGTVTWSLGGLVTGGAGAVQMTVLVDSPLPNGTTITNSGYSIDSNETNPASGSAVSTTVVSSPSLSLAKSGSADPVAAGGLLTYTIDYANTGNGDATGVVVSDDLPNNTTFVSATMSGSLSGATVTWPVGTLVAGNSGSVQLTVMVASPLPDGSLISNDSYSIDSLESTPVSGAAVSTAVTSTPVLSISNSASPDPVDAGGTLTYTLDYGNAGNADATGVVISNALPANTSLVSATAGGTLSGGILTWPVGALATGGSGSVQLVVAIDSPLPNGTAIINDSYSIDSNETPAVGGAAVSITVNSSPLLSLSMSDAPDPVAAGGTIAYTIDYANSGNADATGVVLSDDVPADTTFVSATAGGTLSGGTVTWPLGFLAGGGSGSVQLTVQVDSPLPNGTVISNGTHLIDSNETAPVNGAAITTTVTSAPALYVAMSDSPDPIAAGGTLTYTLDYGNSGSADAAAVVLVGNVPANTTFVSATAGGSEAGGTVTWTIGDLAAGGSAVAQMQVAVDSPLPDGTIITNGSYTIESSQTAPVGGAATTTTVTSTPSLTVTMSATPDPVAAGGSLVYTIDFGNTGNADATGVVLTDAVPADTTFVSATAGGTLSGGTVTWPLGSLAAGGSGSVQLTVQVDSPLPNGSVISNGVYSISSNTTAPVAGAAVSTTVTSTPILSVDKSGGPDPIAAGGTLTYSLTYANTGNADATGVVLTDAVPADTTFVSATAGGTLSGGTVTWPVGSLAGGGSAAVQLVVRVDSPLPNGTVITNGNYGIDCNETAPVNGAPVATTVTSAPVLDLTMTDAPDPVAAGGTITYTLGYGNSGNADVSGAVLTDVIPANTTFATATAGGSLSGNTVTWPVGSLTAGASGAVQLTVVVDSPLADGTVISNDTYSIDSNETVPVNGPGVSTTVTSAPVISVAMTASTDPVAAGDTLTYTLSYANAGNAGATGVTLADDVPADTTFDSATGGGTLSGNTVTWPLGSLITGESGSVQLTVRVASPLANGTVLTNSGYSIDSNETSPVSGAPVLTTVISNPVLSVSKSDGTDPVAAGGTLTYTLDYDNNGNADALGVVLTDVLPSDTTFVSATNGGTLTGNVVTWSLGSLPAGGSGAAQFTVRVDSPLPDGTIITNDTYSIGANGTVAVSGVAITTTVTSAPVLSVSKSDGPDPIAAAGTLTYTLSYDNSGNADATNVVLTDTIPANTSFLSATDGGFLSGNTVSWLIGSLAAGASGSVELSVLVDAPLANGTVITNSAYGIDSNETSPVGGPATTTTVTSDPVLSIGKTAGADPIAAGDTLIYTLSYANSGNADATGVVVTDVVPGNTTFVSATNGGTVSGGSVSWPVGSLPAAASGSVQMVVLIASPLPDGAIITNATYGIDSNETAPVNGTAVATTVSSSPALTITKIDGPDPVAAGGTLTYTLSYANSGNADATGVTVADTVPANTLFVSATAGGSLSGNTVVWSIGNLAAGGSGSVQMIVQVASPLANNTTITNSAYSIDSNETTAAGGAAVSTTVSSAPILQIVKQHAPDPVPMGATLTYTMNFANGGNANATGVVVADSVPVNTTFVSASPGGSQSGSTVTWPIGNLSAGGSGAVQLTVRVDSPLASGTVITADAYSITSNETGTVSGPPDVTLVITAPSPAVTSAFEMQTGSIYVVQGGIHTIEVSGSGFQPGAALNLSADISTDPARILDPTQLEVIIRVGGAAALGPRTLTVTNPDLAAGSQVDALYVTRSPDIGSDCMIDGRDLNLLARAWASSTGDARYNPDADLDGDGFVGPNDLVIFARYFATALQGCP